MKKTIYSILITITFLGCEEEESMNNYINAGEINHSNHYSVFDTIEFRSEESFLNTYRTFYDLNNDGENELIIDIHSNVYNDSLSMISYCEVKPINNCEIVSDDDLDEIKVIKTTYLNFVDSVRHDTLFNERKWTSSKMFDSLNIINENNEWSKSPSLLCRYSNNPSIYNDSVHAFTTFDFIGWNIKSYKYLGYRIQTNEDYVYGWLKLKTDNYSKIYIDKLAYR